jgi:hypothetical protein
MRRPAALWALAVLLTLVSAVWQRLSGPTFPVRLTVAIGADTVRAKLTRTHAGPGDQPLRLLAADTAVRAAVRWKRHPSNDPWITQSFARHGDTLVTALPHQPPAGKLAYRIVLSAGDADTTVPGRDVITRFKGHVPGRVLGPHITLMLLTLLLSTRAGLAAWAREASARRLARAAGAVLLAGGFILGPIALWYAFGVWWEGIPLGWDPTDNKTLFAGLGWAWALWRMRGGRDARGAILAAAILTLAVFALPHSLWGSQIDWHTAGPR